MKSKFTIGITTKNRWDDLKITLLKIKEFEWNEISFLIFDDNSDTICPFDVKEILPNAEIKKFSESKGLITRRDQLVQSISTPYYLSLDDDSYPAEGSIKEALN